MSRSNRKGPYINSNFKTIKNGLQLKKFNIHKNIVNAKRSSEIIPKFVGLTFKVHNGKNNIDLLVTEAMIGYKFGEFCFTRARFAFKKK